MVTSSPDLAYGSPPSPGTGETPTLSTLDFYMARLHGAIERDPAQHEKLIVRIKEILAQVARYVPRLICPAFSAQLGRFCTGGGGRLRLNLLWWTFAETPAFRSPVGFLCSLGAGGVGSGS